MYKTNYKFVLFSDSGNVRPFSVLHHRESAQIIYVPRSRISVMAAFSKIFDKNGKDFSGQKDIKHAPPKISQAVIIQYSVAFVKYLVHNLF